jgi:hypothetical protein
LEGKSKNSFYPLRLERNSLNNKCFFTSSLGIKTTLSGWHSTLRLSSNVIVSRVIKILTCQFQVMIYIIKLYVIHVNRDKRLPFFSSNCIYTRHFELIHCDVWVLPVQLISWCEYHVIFVDDFSRYTNWLRTLRSQHIKCLWVFCKVQNFSWKPVFLQYQTDAIGW